ncbi:hypothetical protein LCGC14_0551630 [marine sediment metagenome]|uniref:Uncharacterized protein n=1 Tax=marine sediment metagenome TaxID=412755 RepID=A0A0F9RUQ3_9ZZZZ
MTENKSPLKEKLKCSICAYEFIPESFHIEKSHFDTINSEGELMSFQDAKHQIVVRPFTSVRGSWVTYCPKCGYIIRFATEIGKKEITQEYARIWKKKTFKEFGKPHKYIYDVRGKPYMDHSDYFIEKVDDIKKQIKNSLDGINFDHWGIPYKEWKTEKTVDTFKFIIRFYTNIKDYCNSQVDDSRNKDMPEKIQALNLPTILEDLLGDILKLQKKVSRDVYELEEDEEELVEKAFIQFIYHLVTKQLKPLDLDKIRIEPEYDFIDINEVYHEIREFLRLYLSSALYIKDFNETFFNPLLEKLGFPPN